MVFVLIEERFKGQGARGALFAEMADLRVGAADAMGVPRSGNLGWG